MGEQFVLSVSVRLEVWVCEAAALVRGSLNEAGVKDEGAHKKFRVWELNIVVDVCLKNLDGVMMIAGSSREGSLADVDGLLVNNLGLHLSGFYGVFFVGLVTFLCGVNFLGGPFDDVDFWWGPIGTSSLYFVLLSSGV